MTRRFTVPVLAAVLGAVAAVAIAALLVNIFTRQQEARNPFYRVVELDDDTTDPAVWGKNFPIQYDSYRRTVDQARTRYGGSEAVPRTPTPDDPRGVVSQSRLEEDPRLKTMWAGYAFATDFREERGHAYMLEDQTFTGRQDVVQQPGTCMHCHASVYVPYKKLGGGDLFEGFEAMNRMKYQEARTLVEHPVSCIDCHEPDTMELRVTRPGFIEGIRKVKALEGASDYDVNRDASRQEMRAYVCGQCHVEYYFQGPEKRLTYPWDKGLRADEILAYYEESGFRDWVHAESGAPALKAQHPEFELWNQGVHARSGVACADCHMPYQRVGAMKVSDHDVQSPMFNINRSCQTCHRWSEQELRTRIQTIQDRTYQTRNVAMDALMALIGDIARARASGAPDADLEAARRHQRRAQFLLDFIEAENSMGFHADQEAVRVLALSLDEARRGQASLPGSRATPGPRTEVAPTPQEVSPGRPPGAPR
jgi:nitrite reductase (cytochrome c-552)